MQGIAEDIRVGRVGFDGRWFDAQGKSFSSRWAAQVMTPGALLPVVSLAVALAAVVGVEAYQVSDPVGPFAASPSGTAAVASDMTAGGPSGDRASPDVSAILSRPLFDPTRRPPPSTISQGSAQLPRLSAVLINGTQRSAIFAGDAGAKPTIAGEGTRVGPYVVQTIRDGEVTVIGPDGLRRLHPRFANSPAGAEAPTAAPQPSILDRLLSTTTPNVGVPGLPR
jgi:hypothetical protein